MYIQKLCERQIQLSQELNYCLSLTTESSPGLDEITYSMLKHLHHNMTKVILYTFNRIYLDNIYPDRWKTAAIVPILKPGKDPQDSSNYRPISLTSCLSKLLQKIINIRLMQDLEEGNYISRAQSGFRTNRSTSDHLCQMESYVQQVITNRKHTLAVFFDLTKAYDTAWRRGVLNILYAFGLRGSLPKFIEKFMSNKLIVVRVGNTLSNTKVIPEGILQESVLSCTCFI